LAASTAHYRVHLQHHKSHALHGQPAAHSAHSASPDGRACGASVLHSHPLIRLIGNFIRVAIYIMAQTLRSSQRVGLAGAGSCGSLTPPLRPLHVCTALPARRVNVSEEICDASRRVASAALSGLLAASLLAGAPIVAARWLPSVRHRCTCTIPPFSNCSDYAALK
jgi:hypothetical protein